MFSVTLLAAAGCGSSGQDAVPTIAPARTFHLTGFEPAATVQPGTPVPVTFTITQPDGTPLTAYRTGAGPHTGVHVIAVSDDLRTLVHHHPPIDAHGRVDDTMAFPSAGTYRVVVDAYPAAQRTNFQLFHSVHVGSHGGPLALPPPASTVRVDGYTVTIEQPPKLHAIQAALLDVRVAGPGGKPARFTPWFGALAHAIFFRAGTLDYFHTHVCAPGATACTTSFGGAPVVGRSTTPGKLTVGVLLPLPGTWRLFLQCRADRHRITAAFTLEVAE